MKVAGGTPGPTWGRRPACLGSSTMRVDSNHGLIRFLSESLASVQGIESSETFLLLKTYDKWI